MDIDSIYVVHENPYTCGITRFSMYLAAALNVPMRPLHSISLDCPRSPLISIKSEELGDSFPDFVNRIVSSRVNYSLFLHDFGGNDLEVDLAGHAEHVFAANKVIAGRLGRYGIKATAAYCPGMAPVRTSSGAEIKVLTFGMAHKLRVRSYRKLQQLLEDSGESYVVRVSSAIHEETHLEKAMFSMTSDLHELFGSHLNFLGFLSDETISRELIASTFFTAFFPNGARENNTSIMTAMAHGTPVITRLDEDSPSFMVHGKTIYNIDEMQCLPKIPEMQAVGKHAQEVVRELDFVSLARLISGPCS